MDFNALLAGITSGVCQTCIGYPLDSMKTWRQNDKMVSRPPITIRNLYKGIQFPLVQSPFTIATGFFVNESVLKKTKNIYMSAFASGIACSIFLCPFDYYKIQYQHHYKPKILQSFNRLHIVSIREVPANVIYFSSYHHLRKNDIPVGFSGAIAGVSSWFLTYPFDTIKSRMQLDHKLSLKDAISQGNLLRGVHITCLRAGIVNYIGFEVYERSRHYFESSSTSIRFS